MEPLIFICCRIKVHNISGSAVCGEPEARKKRKARQTKTEISQCICDRVNFYFKCQRTKRKNIHTRQKYKLKRNWFSVVPSCSRRRDPFPSKTEIASC